MIESEAANSKKNSANEPSAATAFVVDKPLPTASESGNSRYDKKRDCYDYISLLIAVLGLGGLWYYAYWSKVQAVSAVTTARSAGETYRRSGERSS